MQTYVSFDLICFISWPSCDFVSHCVYRQTCYLCVCTRWHFGLVVIWSSYSTIGCICRWV